LRELAEVPECLQVSTTLPDEKTAQRVATILVEERLAACGQVLGPVASTYYWQGGVEHATEWYCHLKTTEEVLPALQRRLSELHPYEVPEIIAIPIVGGDRAYLRWVSESVASSGSASAGSSEQCSSSVDGPAAPGKHDRSSRLGGNEDSP
jgi:periplasmic divalent cation tolerance protein